MCLVFVGNIEHITFSMVGKIAKLKRILIIMLNAQQMETYGVPSGDTIPPTLMSDQYYPEDVGQCTKASHSFESSYNESLYYTFLYG